jgi:hypothetical protein
MTSTKIYCDCENKGFNKIFLIIACLEKWSLTGISWNTSITRINNRCASMTEVLEFFIINIMDITQCLYLVSVIIITPIV